MHEIVKCVCGRILMQCRCPSLDGNKPVRIVSPCQCTRDLSEAGCGKKHFGCHCPQCRAVLAGPELAG